MSLLLPRVAFAPVRCSPVFRNDVVPLWNLFDETISQLERATKRQTRRPFNPRFDVKEANDSYVVEGEIPGFDPKDISIEFLDDGHTLQIKGRTETVSDNGKPNESEQISTSVPEVTQSESASLKSHQPSVEDEVEQPANSSVANEPSANDESSSQAVASTQPAPTVQQTKAPETKHWITERYTGAFSRQFSFPAKVDQEAVKASLKNGILSIALPFAPKPESRRINIE